MHITQITLNEEAGRTLMSTSNQSSTLWSGTVSQESYWFETSYIWSRYVTYGDSMYINIQNHHPMYRNPYVTSSPYVTYGYIWWWVTTYGSRYVTYGSVIICHMISWSYRDMLHMLHIGLLLENGFLNDGKSFDLLREDSENLLSQEVFSTPSCPRVLKRRLFYTFAPRTPF